MSYRGNGECLRTKRARVEFYKGAVNMALTEKVVVSSDLLCEQPSDEKSQGLVLGMFKRRVSGEGRVQRQECAKDSRKGPRGWVQGGHHE